MLALLGVSSLEEAIRGLGWDLDGGTVNPADPAASMQATPLPKDTSSGQRTWIARDIDQALAGVS